MNDLLSVYGVVERDPETAKKAESSPPASAGADAAVVRRRVGPKLPLTVVAVIHNNAYVLERCLRSCADLADEILVIHDGECTDGSLDIARRYTDKIFIRPRAGFSEWHRPEAYRLARNEWVLQIDADEYLSEELREKLSGLLAGDADIYDLAWPLYEKGRRYFGTYKDALFKKSRVYFIGALHEYAKPKDASVVTRRVDYALMHEPGYPNFTWKAFATKWRYFRGHHAEQLTRDFREIPQWNYGKDHWDFPNRARLRHPLLLGMFGSFAVHLWTGVKRSVRYGSWFHLKAEFFYALYFFLLYRDTIVMRRRRSANANK